MCTFVRLGVHLSDDHVVSVGFLVAEEQTLDEWGVLKFEMGVHFFHVEDGLVFIEFVGDAEVVQKFKTLFSVGDSYLFHS
jgi:hypothetical protein